MENFDQYFATFAAFAAVIPFITEWFKHIFKTEGIWSQVVSWVVGLLIATIAYYSKLGIFVDIPLWHTLVIGFGASLISNGVFDTGLVTWFLTVIGILKPTV